MKLIQTLLCLGVVLFLSACQTQKQESPRVVFLAPPDHMLVDCDVPKPPSKKEYMEANQRERDSMNIITTGNLYSALRICRNKLKAVAEWKQEQIKAFDKDKKESQEKPVAKSGFFKAADGVRVRKSKSKDTKKAK